MTCMRCRKGVTLVEIMIALVVLLLVMMGLLQAALLSIDHNLRNMERDEAVRIADERMNGCLCPGGPYTGGTTCPPACYGGLRTISFSGPGGLTGMATPAPGTWTAPVAVTRNFRDLSRTYNVSWNIVSVDADTIRIAVAVGWNHRGELVHQAPTGTEYVHQISTLRRTT